MRFEIPIRRWAARAGALKTETDWRCWLAAPTKLADTISAEHIDGMDPMSLRRVGRLGNAALAISKALLSGIPRSAPLSVITVSELGELEANDALIENVVGGTPVSPQRFAASVHNHILGQVCINLDLQCRGSASTGARCGLEIGLIEALGELESGRRVLVLMYEPNVGEHYERFHGGRSPEHMVGVLLQPGAGTRLLLTRAGAGRYQKASRPRALRWLSLVTGDASELQGPDGWHWKNVAG